MSLDIIFFLSIALFGALFLAISFVIGEIGGFLDDAGDALGDHLDLDTSGHDLGDGGDEGPSPLSLRNLMAFLTAYGASGLITSSLGWSTLASSLFAVLPGLLLAAVAYRFMRMLYGQQSTSMLEVSSLVGQSGIIDLAIPESGLGRVTVNTGTGQTTFIARSATGLPIPQGERVVVRATLGSDLIVARAP